MIGKAKLISNLEKKSKKISTDGLTENLVIIVTFLIAHW